MAPLANTQQYIKVVQYFCRFNTLSSKFSLHCNVAAFAAATLHRLAPPQHLLRVERQSIRTTFPLAAESVWPLHSSAFALLLSPTPPALSRIAWRRCCVAFPSQASRNQERSPRIRFMGEFAPVMRTASRIYREFLFPAAC